MNIKYFIFHLIELRWCKFIVSFQNENLNAINWVVFMEEDEDWNWNLEREKKFLFGVINVGEPSTLILWKWFIFGLIYGLM